MRTLVAWLGGADLHSAGDDGKNGVGPIARVLQEQDFDSVLLLNNYPKKQSAHYGPWIRKQTGGDVEIRAVELTSPTEFGEIYEAAVAAVSDLKKGANTETEITFHLSPGTPQMATVWVILAKTRFPEAALVESSEKGGVKSVAIPFDLSAEYLSDLLREPDLKLQRLTEGLPPDAPQFEGIIHRSAVMQRAVALARRLAAHSIPVMIEGESGTGKELFARAIHNASLRSKNALVPVNCGAIPKDLFDSQLFGHKKGAFTGADKMHKGYFEAADGGTIFLDEVGELPLEIQVKLLRVLQEGEVTRLGESTPIKVDVRVIAATNKVLSKQIDEGEFRQDLFYRLVVGYIRLPPLRARKGDLGLLLECLLDDVNDKQKDQPGYVQKKLSAGAKNLLIRYDWPGNIREMINTLHRASFCSVEKTITSEDIKDSLLEAPVNSSNGDGILNKPIEEGIDLEELIDTVKVHYIKRALEERDGKISGAAELLGVGNYQTLSNWLKKYDIKP